VGACKEDEVVGSHSYVAPEVMRRQVRRQQVNAGPGAWHREPGTGNLACVARQPALSYCCSALQEYGPAADVWSLGILMHTLLCGEVPFESDLQARLSPVMFFQKLWTTVSAPAKSLLKDLLEAKEPRARMGLAALLRHSWLAMAEEPVLQAQHTFEELQPGAHRMRCPSHCEPQARTCFTQEPVRRGMVFARVQPARLRGMRGASSTAGRRHTFCARSVSAPSLLDRAAHTCTCALVPSDSTTALADAVHSRRVSPVRGVSLDISPARSAEGSDVDVDGVAFVLPAAPKGIAATSQRAPNPLQVAESI
jgi:serine/threonine protein kinase